MQTPSSTPWQASKPTKTRQTTASAPSAASADHAHSKRRPCAQVRACRKASTWAPATIAPARQPQAASRLQPWLASNSVTVTELDGPLVANDLRQQHAANRKRAYGGGLRRAFAAAGRGSGSPAKLAAYRVLVYGRSPTKLAAYRMLVYGHAVNCWCVS